MSYQKIRGALDTHLQDLGSSLLIFPSSTHHPKHGEAFISASIKPGRVRSILLGLGMPKEHQGAYILDVYENDMHSAYDEIDELCAHFQSGLVLSFGGLNVTLLRSEVGTEKSTLKFSKIPLSIFWRCHF